MGYTIFDSILDCNDTIEELKEIICFCKQRIQELKEEDKLTIKERNKREVE